MGLGDYLTGLLTEYWDSFLDLIQKIFNSAWTMLKDLLFWILDQLLTLSTMLLSTVDVSAITDAIPAFSSLPEPVLNVLSLCGFAQCMLIIGGAIVIRLMLQLIPFTRLGS